MKKFLSLIVLVLVLFLIGCNYSKGGEMSLMDASGKSGYSGVSGVVPRESGGDASYSLEGEPMAPTGDLEGEYVDEVEPDKPEETNEIELRAGQLTASATMDNLKYEFWKSLLTSNQEGEGIFQNYNKSFAFKTANRIALKFPQGTVAKVSLLNGEETEFVGITNAGGVCYVFAKEERDSYKIKIDYIDKDYNVVTIDDEVTGDKEYTIESLEAKRELIEIMFVIDATGSMGDEMRYLQAEITDVVKKVKEANDNVRILISVMVYRDKGDEYVTRYSDFTEDVSKQISFLNKQSANGGGDFPEAVETALAEAVTKQWTSGNSTKILVHVADAPAHNKDVKSWADSVNKLAAMGIQILTVASSGIDKQTEYFFRCQSILTNGVYVHLTNDSGIGGNHIDATTEEKEEVELLNDCLVRLINGFHTGDFGTPINWRQSQSTPLS